MTNDRFLRQNKQTYGNVRGMAWRRVIGALISVSSGHRLDPPSPPAGHMTGLAYVGKRVSIRERGTRPGRMSVKAREDVFLSVERSRRTREREKKRRRGSESER